MAAISQDSIFWMSDTIACLRLFGQSIQLVGKEIKAFWLPVVKFLNWPFWTDHFHFVPYFEEPYAEVSISMHSHTWQIDADRSIAVFDPQASVWPHTLPQSVHLAHRPIQHIFHLQENVFDVVEFHPFINAHRIELVVVVVAAASYWFSSKLWVAHSFVKSM